MSGDLFYDTLPKAFPKSETMSYFRGASTYTRDDIIVGNMRLVSSIVTSYKVSDEDKKDLFQIGLIGLFDNEPVGQKEIAFRLNISQSYISRLINKILSNLKG